MGPRFKHGVLYPPELSLLSSHRLLGCSRRSILAAGCGVQECPLRGQRRKQDKSASGSAAPRLADHVRPSACRNSAKAFEIRVWGPRRDSAYARSGRLNAGLLDRAHGHGIQDRRTGEGHAEQAHEGSARDDPGSARRCRRPRRLPLQSRPAIRKRISILMLVRCAFELRHPRGQQTSLRSAKSGHSCRPLSVTVGVLADLTRRCLKSAGSGRAAF
jgi:hypothetical protein